MSFQKFCLLLLIPLLSDAAVKAADKIFPPVIPGIEVLIQTEASILKGKKIGLITNQSGVDRNLCHDVDLLKKMKDVQLVALFAPEHGIRGIVQAGDQVENSTDPSTGLPVYSLYGKYIRPTADMLRGIDVLLYDIQDVGLRFYTYISTLAECMKAAAANHIPFLVLDRPAPLNGVQVEGNILEDQFHSMVGPFPIPVRYGLTPGELAMWAKDYLQLDLPLKVIRMKNWHRRQWYDETGLSWVPPSPNLPTLESALVYSGTCFLEGTNVSEGRGTAKPFELLGAPWIDGPQMAKQLNNLSLPGVRFRPVSFSPSFSKFRGENCQGVQIHVIDRNLFSPIETGMRILLVLNRMYPREFSWEGKHFDRLIGNGVTRFDIERGESWENISGKWQVPLRAFLNQRERFFLYP
jgi:uncharacterized protein YbbC (DUF1343 family)